MNSGILFPHFICRVGGLPSNTFNTLRANHTFKQLKRLFNLDLTITKEKEIISEILFKEIPSIEENRDRGFLLNLKRDLFKGKNISHDKLERAKNLITTESWGKITDFSKLLIIKQKMEVDLKKSYSKETTLIRKKFKSYISNPDFQKGLLISSDSLYKTQNAYLKSANSKLNGRLEQAERGLLRYFSRMAMKATPFGTFCSIIPGKIINKTENNSYNKFIFKGNPQKKESLLQINKGIYGNLIDHCKKRDEIKRWFPLELNPTITNEKNILFFLTEQDGKEIFQRLPNNPVVKLIVKELQKFSLPKYKELIKLIAVHKEIEAEEQEIQEYVDRLLEIGVIRFKIGIPEQEINWAKKLRTILKPIKDEHAIIIIELLEYLIDNTKYYKDSNVKKRQEILSKLNKKIESIFNKIGITTNLKVDLPFYEDATANCTAQINVSNKFHNVESSLGKYINLTKKLAYPRTEQINMRHFFEVNYNNVKEEIPLLQFYEDFYKKHYKEHLEKQQKLKANNYNGKLDEELKNFNIYNPFKQKLINKIQEAQTNIKNIIVQKWISNQVADEIIITSKELSGIVDGIPENNEVSFSASLFSQMIISNIQEIEPRLLLPGGKYLLGYGKYFSRFLFSFTEEQQEELCNNNMGLSENTVMAEICGDANFNANLHPPILKWEISYPTSEGGLAEYELKSTDLVVEKNPNNKTTLRMRHKPTGKYIIPLDLGFLNPMMRPPLFQLLSKFAPPSNYSMQIPDRPILDKMKKHTEKNESKNIVLEITKEEDKHSTYTPQITYRPRIVFDTNIVLARKCWIVPSQLFPNSKQNESDSEYFIRINRFVNENEIPSEVYIRINVHPVKNDIKQIVDDNKNTMTKEAKGKEPEKIITERNGTIVKDKNTSGKEEAEQNKKENIKKTKQNKMSRDLYKPQYIDFRNPLLVNLFGKMTVNLKNYTAYLEERYPAESETYEYEGNKYITEQIFQIDIPAN